MTTTEALQACREIAPGRSYMINMHHGFLATAAYVNAPEWMLAMMPGIDGANSTTIYNGSLEGLMSEYRRRSNTTTP